MSLSAKNLVWTTAGKSIVDDVSVELAPGSMIGVLGPNGSGKSSLLRLLTGLTSPTSGAVPIDGRPLTSLPRKALARSPDRSPARAVALLALNRPADAREVAAAGKLGGLWLIPFTPALRQ